MLLEEQLPYLIQLLDDSDPATQSALEKVFAASSGDISHELAALMLSLGPKSEAKVRKLLRPAKRAKIVADWQVPEEGVSAISDDWESFEDRLRMISDFLHDGISLRASLVDMIDILAQDAWDEMAGISADSLRVWMFESGRFKGNTEHYYLPENSDLCWVIKHGLGNPLSLAILFILLGQRLHLDITGCNYPGHFLARISMDGEPSIVDCFHGGRIVTDHELLAERKEISLAANTAIKEEASIGHMLWRLLRNLEYALSQVKRTEDAEVFAQLVKSLH